MSSDFDPGIHGLTRFRRIGSGGFSTVFVAWEEEFTRWVAVKIFHDLDETAGRRFGRERSLMGQSSGHPNVITPIRSGVTVDGKPYLVMQYLEGGSLQDLINRGEVLPWRDAVSVVRPIAEALGDSHEAGILHKDVKPANILLARNGTPSLTDFGIASVRGSTVTQTAFTFSHSPPETFLGGRDARDERSDLYSLGSTLYAIIAGHSPFADPDDDSQLAWLDRVTNRPVPPLGADPGLDRFFNWVLAKNPDDRPQNAEEFIHGLDRVLAGEAREGVPTVAAGRLPTNPTLDPVLAPDSRWEPPFEPVPGSPSGRSRSPVAAWAVALVALAGLGAAVWFALFRQQAGDAAGPAPATAATQDIEVSADGSSSSNDPVAPAAEVQQAILLFQDPDSDVRTLVTEGVLPGTAISEGGFTFRSCETQLVGLQAAFGGPELSQLRDEIDRWPSGAPEGYVDPAGADRGFRERLEAYVAQTEAGYRSCLDEADIAPVGAQVLSGWASMQSFLCVTGVAAQVTLADGTVRGCPSDGELALCSQILAPLLDDFFQAFPDSSPDAGAACQAAIEDDPALFAALSSSA